MKKSKKFTSKITALLLTIAITLSVVMCVPISVDAATAYSFEENGLQYLEESDGNLTIVGFNANTIPENLVIPSTVQDKTVTKIAEETFYLSQIKSVEIPATITYIDELAFGHCKQLQSVNMLCKLTSISPNTFYRCNNLTSVSLPDNIKSLDSLSFAYCYNLKSIDLPTSLESIGSSAFIGCSRLEQIIIPNNVNTVYSNAFKDCSSLKTVSLPESIEFIDRGTFYNCTSLTTINIPNTVKEIKYEAFYKCTSLASIKLPNTLESIEEKAFSVCTSLEEIVIPSSVKTISSDVFENCYSLKKATIPETFTSIPSGMFAGCKALSEFNLPKGLTKICNSAFANCEAIKEITFPGALSSVGNAAFAGCTSLEKVNNSNIVETYGVNCFSRCTSLKSFELPKNIPAISTGMFQECSSLEQIVIPATVSACWERSFSHCTALTNLIFEERTTPLTLGNNAFNSCTSLTDIDLSQVASIGKWAFKGCTSIKTVTIPDTLTSDIGEGAFMDCTGLKTVTLSNSIVYINLETFSGCTSLEKVNIYSSTRRIDNSAFNNCTSLSKVNFVDGNSLKRICKKAFYNCHMLTQISLPNIVNIEQQAFENCYSLEKAELGEKLETLDWRAFYNCYSLQNITLPDSLESIGYFSVGFFGDDEQAYHVPDFVIFANEGSLGETYATTLEVERMLPAPKLKSVANASNGITVKWNAVNTSSTGKYRVYRKTSGTSWKAIADTTGTSYTDTSVTSGTKYTYTVKFVPTSNDNASTYDKTGLSITRLLSPKVTKIENTYTGPKVTWSKVAGATKYRVYVKTADGWKNKGFVTGTSYTHTSAIKGKTYSYTVRPYASDTDYGLYNSTGWSNKYIPAPEISSVTNTTSGVKVKWNKVDGAKKYRVYVKGGSATSWKKKCDTTSLSYTHTTASSGTTYTYTVRCLDASGNVISGYNPDGVTKTYYKAPKISKLSNTAQGVSLAWDKIAGATYYRVYVKVDGEYQTLTDTTDTSYLHTDVISGSTYTYTVRCISSDGTHLSTYYTDGWSKKYIAQPEIKSAENTESGVALSWDAVQGAEKYRVFVKGGSATSWKKLTDTTSLSFTHKTGKAGTTYTYTVRCVSADSKSYTSSYNTEGVVVENYKLP